MEITVKVYKKPTLKDPVMICGLPGIGYVAWLAANHLQKTLNAELFAEIFSPSFSPKVWLTDEGVVNLMKGDFHWWRNDASNNDLIIFTANEQPYSPEGQYELADRVLRVGKKLGVRLVITMGGMHAEKYPRQPRVYGGATEVELVKGLEKYGVIKLAGGAITGANGLLFGLAKARKIPAICLLAETPGYISLDASAAKAALDIICKMLNITVDTSILERQAKENLEALQRAREMARAMEPTEARRAPSERELHYVS